MLNESKITWNCIYEGQENYISGCASVRLASFAWASQKIYVDYTCAGWISVTPAGAFVKSKHGFKTSKTYLPLIVIPRRARGENGGIAALVPFRHSMFRWGRPDLDTTTGPRSALLTLCLVQMGVEPCRRSGTVACSYSRCAMGYSRANVTTLIEVSVARRFGAPQRARRWRRDNTCVECSCDDRVVKVKRGIARDPTAPSSGHHT